MDIAWMLVVVSVLGGAEKPETRVVVQAITTKEDCNFRKNTMTGKTPVATDATSGRALMMETYVCTPVNPTQLSKDIARLPK